MVFFKRLSRSRSRSNSRSYVDNYDPRHDSKTNNSAQYDDHYAHSAPIADRTRSLDGYGDDGVPVSAHSEKGPRLGDPIGNETAIRANTGGADMYARRERPTEVNHQYANTNTSFGSQPVSAGARPNMSNGYDASSSLPSKSNEPAPNLLVEAFNQAIRPYSDKIENLEGEIADLRAYISSLERQQTEVHAWIDKRGLRPGMLPLFPWIIYCKLILIVAQTYLLALHRSWIALAMRPLQLTQQRL